MHVAFVVDLSFGYEIGAINFFFLFAYNKWAEGKGGGVSNP